MLLGAITYVKVGGGVIVNTTIGGIVGCGCTVAVGDGGGFVGGGVCDGTRVSTLGCVGTVVNVGKTNGVCVADGTEVKVDGAVIFKATAVVAIGCGVSVWVGTVVLVGTSRVTSEVGTLSDVAVAGGTSVVAVGVLGVAHATGVPAVGDGFGSSTLKLQLAAIIASKLNNTLPYHLNFMINPTPGQLT